MNRLTTLGSGSVPMARMVMKAKVMKRVMAAFPG
jgi:hypothetical protein